MRMISRIAAVSAVLLSVGSATGQEKAPGVVVTQETYCRAESDRTFNNTTKLAGGVNRFFHFRAVTPLDNQTVVRMNRDTLYSAAIVDTSKGATITVPKMPAGRYCSVLLIDNDHYCPGVIYEAGTHQLPKDTKYLGVLVRIQLLKPTDPEDVALVNKLQDQFVIKAGSADPFPEPKWDAASLEKLTAAYKAEFDKYEKYPDGFMAARGKADEKLRHLACRRGLGPVSERARCLHQLQRPAAGQGAPHRDLQGAGEQRLLVHHRVRRGRIHEERQQHPEQVQHQDERGRHVHGAFRFQGRLRRRAEPARCERGLELPDAGLPAGEVRAGRQL